MQVPLRDRLVTSPWMLAWPPEGSGVGLPLPSQLELSRHALTVVLGEGAGRAPAAAPCLLTTVLQKEAQHGRISDHLNSTWGGGKGQDIIWEVVDLGCCDANTVALTVVFRLLSGCSRAARTSLKATRLVRDVC